MECTIQSVTEVLRAASSGEIGAVKQAETAVAALELMPMFHPNLAVRIRSANYYQYFK